MTDPEPALEPGRVLSDRYRLDAEIGRGGAGRVFRGHDDRLDRAVALKVLTDLGDAAVARFRREAATAARIRHPNVVTLHDAGVDGAPYLVMTLVDGPSLADRVEADGPLDLDDLRRLARDLLAGLDATHEAGVFHRDLTPRNIMFDAAGTALIADFGIARGPDDPTVTAEHTIMGTRPFVAPERLRGEDATVATDLFAVGVTLRFAATGHHGTPLPSGHPFGPLVAAFTAEDPAGRPDSGASAVARHLDGAAVAAQPTTELLPVDTPPPTEAPSSVMQPEVRTGPRRTAPTPATGTDAAATDTPDAPDRRRPLVVVGMLAALAVAAIVGSGAVRDSGTPRPADDAARAGQAPSFAPDAPGDSARELADWIRTQGG